MVHFLTTRTNIKKGKTTFLNGTFTNTEDEFICKNQFLPIIQKSRVSEHLETVVPEEFNDDFPFTDLLFILRGFKRKISEQLKGPIVRFQLLLQRSLKLKEKLICFWCHTQFFFFFFFDETKEL